MTTAATSPELVLTRTQRKNRNRRARRAAARRIPAVPSPRPQEEPRMEPSTTQGQLDQQQPDQYVDAPAIESPDAPGGGDSGGAPIPDTHVAVPREHVSRVAEIARAIRQYVGSGAHHLVAELEQLGDKLESYL